MAGIYEPSINDNFVRVFSNYIKKYQKQSEELFNSRRGKNSIMVDENLASYFPARVSNGIDELAAAIINPANCHSSTVNLSTRDKFNFTLPETIYIYIDIKKTKFCWGLLGATTNFLVLPIEHEIP